jgi:hypothetical protein
MPILMPGKLMLMQGPYNAPRRIERGIIGHDKSRPAGLICREHEDHRYRWTLSSQLQSQKNGPVIN